MDEFVRLTCGGPGRGRPDMMCGGLVCLFYAGRKAGDSDVVVCTVCARVDQEQTTTNNTCRDPVLASELMWSVRQPALLRRTSAST